MRVVFIETVDGAVAQGQLQLGAGTPSSSEGERVEHYRNPKGVADRN